MDLLGGSTGWYKNTKEDIFNPRLSAIYIISQSESSLQRQQSIRKPTALEYGEQGYPTPITSGPAAGLGETLAEVFGSDVTYLKSPPNAQSIFSNPTYLPKSLCSRVGLSNRSVELSLRFGVDAYYDLHRDTIGNVSGEQRFYECAEEPDIYVVSNLCVWKEGSSDTPYDSLGIVTSLAYSPPELEDWTLQGSVSYRNVARASKRWPAGGHKARLLELKSSVERDPDDTSYTWLDSATNVPTWLANLSVTIALGRFQLGLHSYYASSFDARLGGLKAVQAGTEPYACDSASCDRECTSRLHVPFGNDGGWLELAVMAENLLDTNERQLLVECKMAFL